MLKLVDISKNEKIRLFTNISIEISSKCNRKCFFCPNGYHSRPDEEMSWEMIKKIVTELKELNYKDRLEFYIYNEPTRDKRLIDIVKYVRQELPGVTQMINTNGDYFKSEKDILFLFEAGINQMQINIYSAQDGESDINKFENGIRLAKRRHEKVQGWVDNLAEYGVRQDLSLYQGRQSKKRIAKVIAKYGIKKTTNNEDLEGVNHFSNRSGAIPDFRDPVKGPMNKYCTRPFRFLNINWKGESLLCCNDYFGQVTFGNAKEKSLIEMWNDVNLHVYRLKLQNGKRDCFLCHNCDFNGGGYPHRMDNVTFGKERDQEILSTNLSNRESIFN